MPELSDPTPREEIKQRQGPGGRTLDYVDARFVMQRLDDAVGSFNWQDKYEDLANGSVRCCIGIRHEDGWVWKCDVGDPSDIEATKGAYSDAFKRAAVKWGIARDLYGDHAAPAKPAAKPAKPAEVERLGPEAVSPEWDGLEVLPEAAQEAFGGLLMNEGRCPDHDKAWRDGAKGWYCPTPLEKEGGRVTKWCQQKPSKAWAASQENG